MHLHGDLHTISVAVLPYDFQAVAVRLACSLCMYARDGSSFRARLQWDACYDVATASGWVCSPQVQPILEDVAGEEK